ncbi:hypothetical protein DJ79_08790 [Halorubrum ezzemoulense]|uniref:Uncharacterized protein n=1 Tax=Halorubrum ezzemoulense TaxID=337243 RepID=A0A256JF89_HALEZ|nr:hypothetical protein [Halorubrum ezzemoulense]OYR67525.1 hypothetical protein DJ79_08790 [Halorubrum ezzemoulense]
MSDDPRLVAATDARDLSSCEVCGASIDPEPPDGFTRYARQVAGYLDHFAEAHPDHPILDVPEGYL